MKVGAYVNYEKITYHTNFANFNTKVFFGDDDANHDIKLKNQFENDVITQMGFKLCFLQGEIIKNFKQPACMIIALLRPVYYRTWKSFLC